MRIVSFLRYQKFYNYQLKSSCHSDSSWEESRGHFHLQSSTSKTPLPKQIEIRTISKEKHTTHKHEDTKLEPACIYSLIIKWKPDRILTKIFYYFLNQKLELFKYDIPQGPLRIRWRYHKYCPYFYLLHVHVPNTTQKIKMYVPSTCICNDDTCILTHVNAKDFCSQYCNKIFSWKES